MTYSREVEQEIAWEALMEAWHDLHEAHPVLEGVNPDKMNAYSREHVGAAKEAANEYYKALQRWEKTL